MVGSGGVWEEAAKLEQSRGGHPTRTRHLKRKKRKRRGRSESFGQYLLKNPSQKNLNRGHSPQLSGSAVRSTNTCRLAPKKEMRAHKQGWEKPYSSPDPKKNQKKSGGGKKRHCRSKKSF